VNMGAVASAATRADAARQREALARMHGAAQALSTLSRRGPGSRLRAAEYAADLLGLYLDADWRGLLLPASSNPATAAGAVRAGGQVKVSDPAVLHLAIEAMRLRCSTLHAAERPERWAGLADFFATVLPNTAPPLRVLAATVLFSRSHADDVRQEVIDGLLADYEWRRDTYGPDAYLTSIARTNLANAYRTRGAGTDLADASEFCRQEISARARRYGPEHPFTLVACNMLARCLLAQAEVAGDEQERRTLARQAYDEADRARATRDQLYGVTAANSTLSRRYQGHALLLLGDLQRARSSLHYALAFETARNDNAEWRGSGATHLLLARASLGLGDRAAALQHAATAHRLLAADNPAAAACRAAYTLLEQLGGTDGDAAGFTGW
jgi:DNA-directed RNA polymerase specialized sigma24 family protein